MRPAIQLNLRDAFVRTRCLIMGQRPNRQLRTIARSELPENAVQILLDRTFGQMQFVRNLLVRFGLRHKLHYLLLPEAQLWVERTAFGLRHPARLTNPAAPVTPKLSTASKTASQRAQLSELNCHRYTPAR